MQNMGARGSARRRGRRGQAAVFIALILFVLVIFGAMATNLGILVNDKIRMQNTVDLATYAVAYKEAQTLNELVDLNHQIAQTVATCRDILVGGYWATCNCQYRDPMAEMVITSCKGILDAQILAFVYKAQYYSSVQPALDAGKETADANFEGIKSQTSFMEWLPGSPTFPYTYSIDYSLNLAGGAGVPLPSIADYEQVKVTLNYMRIIMCPVCEGACCPVGIVYPSRDVYAWFYKDDADPEVWVLGRVAGTPKKRFLDIAYSSGGGDGGFFGASSTGGTDMLYAYAVAKPYEGSVGPTRASSSDRNGRWMAGPLYISGAAGSESTRQSVLGMVDEYRARLAGMEEELEGGVDPTTLAVMDGATLGRFWNPMYFSH